MTYSSSSKPQRKKLRVSIVIPVYNEAERIGDCLRAIAQQIVQPYEVIVVDNNSTDATTAVAARFPFVRLVREPRQGVVYARRRGFDEAHGDIIGSIDADADIPIDWVWTVRQIFAETDAHAVAGMVTYRDIAWSGAVNRVDLMLRRYFARIYPAAGPAQGANMAMGREAWAAVRDSLCVLTGLHEDMDLAVHLGEASLSVRFDERLKASLGSRQCAMDWRSFRAYSMANPYSYRLHGLRAWSMWWAAAIVVALYPVLRALHQGYDTRSQKFSWAQLLRGGLVARVNPATFVDGT